MTPRLLAALGCLTLATSAIAQPPQLSRKVLDKDDFEYVGAFQLPRQACGMSTAFGESGLAMRHAAGGKLHFMTGSHRNGQDAIYEVEFPGYALDPAKWPTAPLVKEYGTAIYADAKRIKKGKEVGWTHGLTFDERTNRFYFSYGSWYNIPNENDPCIAYAHLRDDKIVDVVGGWNAPPDLAHNQKMRGGSLIIPDWFAAQYTDGRRLGVGFGGVWAGIQSCSRGPFLAAAREPAETDGGGTLDVLPLISHDVNHYAIRDTDYRSEVDWSPNPVNGVGKWGLFDETLGAGIWIDLPDKHGLLLASHMGHGRVWYENSDRHAERHEVWWWVYDPADLAAVALGKKRVWEPTPRYWKVDYTPRQLDRIATTGLAFDAETRTLFVLTPASVKGEVESFPVVRCYRVTK
jgi:hypothetical protein